MVRMVPRVCKAGSPTLLHALIFRPLTALQDFGCPQLSALGWAESPVGAETPELLLHQFITIPILAWLCFLLQAKTRCAAP